ncbi:alpha/beta hydrolase [Lysobacter sp. BMK333-48F3]|uniref:dienelactone hydrolase family protein n=1 Tax=Lysobacter sp. BMK333-48F3 TaxID=2867962 RepID=UPI001C8C4BB1|nr:alpha/beta hydrolase [Lysobacter sp. BMK333-48F3]MBX9403258.1 alpha/beta hydrolase [Lysobacter sp. BMK333-48F3]
MKSGSWVATFLSLFLLSPNSLASPALHTEDLMLPVQIDGRTEALGAYLARPDKPGRYPIALIVNGSSPEPRQQHADGLAHIARDFAHRGWLAVSVSFRGYGYSSGTRHDDAGSCKSPTVAKFFEPYAKDLAAALSTIKHRPDADPSHSIGLGISIGGVSVLALAAQPDRPLDAAINLSGGLYPDYSLREEQCPEFNDDLVQYVGKLAERSRASTLWLYAENDQSFSPELARRMLKSYRAKGGAAELAVLPPFWRDGHQLYRHEASPLIRPRIDSFLRGLKLPSIDSHALASLNAILPPESRKSLQVYLEGDSSEKALALSGDKKLFWGRGYGSLDDARSTALKQCQSEATGCRIVAENNELVESWQDPAAI